SIFFFFLFFYSFSPLHILPSFPTRRSSDLNVSFLPKKLNVLFKYCYNFFSIHFRNNSVSFMASSTYKCVGVVVEDAINETELFRSEEHTSELQSRRDLVCRLLLEKKKHINT